MKKSNIMKKLITLLVLITLITIGCGSSPEQFKATAEEYVDKIIFQTNPTSGAKDCVILGNNKDKPNELMLLFMYAPAGCYPEVVNVVVYEADKQTIKFLPAPKGLRGNN